VEHRQDKAAEHEGKRTRSKTLPKKSQAEAVNVVVPPIDNIKTAKRSRQLAQSILTIFEVALLEEDRESQRKKFNELLLNLLKRW
jgi:hypothetical protein